jgi:hypothetical protein
MDGAGQQVLTAEQEAGRKIAVRRMIVTQVIGGGLLIAGLLLWGVRKGAPMPHLSLPVGLMLVVGYALPLYGLFQFTQTLRALGIRTKKTR